MRFWRPLFALVFGALLPLAFSPFNVYAFAFFSPAFLLYFWLKSTPKQAALLGFLFAFGFFGVGISWIYISIHYFGNASVLLATVMTMLVVGLMSLHFALFGYLFRRVFQHKSSFIQCLLAFPALWVLFELINTAVFGFPWLLLGYSQITNPLRGLAPIIGVYGLSLSVTIISGALVALSLDPSRFTRAVSLATVLVIVSAGLLFENHAWTKQSGSPIQAALIQGNIPQSIKWDPNYTAQNIDVYKQLTLSHLGKGLIVWPEGALPVMLQDMSAFTASLGKVAKAHGMSIIFGAPFENKKENRYYNSIVMIGKEQGVYLKRHLVPFGEYTPFASVIEPIAHYFHMQLSDLSAGPAKQPLLKLQDTVIAPFICYEIIFPQEVLDTAKNSQLLLTISDDSWFGRSIALAQHLQMAQMRSLETGRYMLLATNTGITAIISALGKVIKSSAIDQRQVITGDVVPMSGKTPLMVWHYYPVFVVLGLMLVVGMFLC